MTDLDRSTLELRDPDTDSEPWPAYVPERSGMVLVYVVVVVIVVVGAGLWWWAR